MTLAELLLAVAVGVTTMALSIPLISGVLADLRTTMAARYVEARLMSARMHAVKRSSRVALRFEPAGLDYRFAEYMDGNGNGVRNSEISAGVDIQLAPRLMLRERFPGVTFGLRPGIPDVDGFTSASATEGIRIGASRILTLSPDGTATPGTLYLHGARQQYAVRVFGPTGRTRVLRFEPGTRQWVVR